MNRLVAVLLALAIAVGVVGILALVARWAGSPPPAGKNADDLLRFEEVLSPATGTFRTAPAAAMGAKVAAGDLLGHVDDQPVRAPIGGRITRIELADGEEAQFGQLLFRIEPGDA